MGPSIARSWQLNNWKRNYESVGLSYRGGQETWWTSCVFTLKDFRIITIHRNDTFILEMVEKLHTFFNKYFRDAVINALYYKYSHEYNFDWLFNTLWSWSQESLKWTKHTGEYTPSYKYVDKMFLIQSDPCTFHH